MTTLSNRIRTARRNATPTSAEKAARGMRKRVRIDPPRGLTQTEAAARAEMKQPQWTLYETGRTVPTLGTLRRIADALAVFIESLLPEPEGEER